MIEEKTELHNDTMIDRVARDLRFVMYGVPLQRPIDGASPWLIYAKTAIKAMREPTDTMADAGRWPAEDEGPVACWRAMIDEALK